jgi:beta-lactamase regulating signal transducer with metallopeptidase domain
MNPEIFCYDYGANFLAIIKNGYAIDIACSEKNPKMYSEKDRVTMMRLMKITEKRTKVRARDLALYTHWPIHTKEFWDLLNEI